MTTTTPPRPVLTRRFLDDTERFDPIACLDDRIRHLGEWMEPAHPGRYIQVQGREGSLLIPLSGNIIRLGRGLGASIHLDDDSVSRRHAVLVLHSSGARILDDRSANGTLVNGRRIARAELLDGDIVTLGRFTLRYRVVE